MVTIDGGAAVGKSTISKMISENFKWHYLDSGLLYRLVAAQTTDDEHALKIIENSNYEQMIHNDDIEHTHNLRSEAISKKASQIAKDPQIRDALIPIQRKFAKSPGLVADGRDMGTVIFPSAIAKIFLYASDKVVAERRYKELFKKNSKISKEEVYENIKIRNARDSQRKVAPVRPAIDAFQVDTSMLDSTQVYKIITEYLHKKRVK